MKLKCGLRIGQCHPFSGLSVNRPVALRFAAAPCWRDPRRSKQLSTVAILGFHFGFYHVVPLSFLRSNQPCFIVMFLLLADQIIYRSYVCRQLFRLRSLASLYLIQQGQRPMARGKDQVSWPSTKKKN